MTGKPFWKKRVILSKKVDESLTEKKDFNKAALNFKQALASSLSSPTLNVGLAVKAAMDASGAPKLNYENSDGKTRTNKGGSPGMVELPGGYRMVPEEKSGEGKVLSLFPSKLSRKSLSKTPNFGWISKSPDASLDGFIKKPKNELQVRIRKYKVNSRTNEIIENTEKLVDPFSTSGAETEHSPLEGKALQGQTIGSSGGGNIMTRAAGALGIIIDELGKMRCPPGTPAANQFTDHMGTNCFGVSAGDFVNFALDEAAKLERDGKMSFWRQLVQENVAAYHGYKKYEEIPGLGRTLWRDASGKLITNSWRDAHADSTNSRVFINGMINGQDRLKQQDMAIAQLMGMFPSVKTTPASRVNNEDLMNLFDEMRTAGVHDVKFTGRLNDSQVEKLIVARLERVWGWNDLDRSRQEKLIKVDTERYYETERALLESYADEIIKNPLHMRTISEINWETKSYDDPYFDYASTESQGFGVGAVVNIDINAIMKAQELALPGLRPDERMRIDVTGFATDAEKGKNLANYLMTASSTANEAAAMVEYRGFARNIMKHELAHTVQFVAIENEIERQITTNGFISFTNPKTGKIKKITDAQSLTGSDMRDLMVGINDSINIADLNGALSRIDVVSFLGGSYALDHDKTNNELWAMETCAELWALRDAGIIHGADIDAALDWMDSTVNGKYTAARGRINLTAAGVANNGNYRPIPSPINVPTNIPTSPTPGMMNPQQIKDSLKSYKEDIKVYNELELAQEIADNLDVMDVINARIEMDSADGLDISGHQLELDAHIEANKIVHREYHKRFGVSPSESKKKLEKQAQEIRDASGTLTQDQMMSRQRAKDIAGIQNYAKTLSSDEIIDSIVGYESRMRTPGITLEKKQALTEEAQIYRDAYKAVLSESGDARTWAQQRRELDKKIHERLFPAPSDKKTPIATFKNHKGKNGTEEFATAQRDELMKTATWAQREAVVELADTNTTSVGQLLNPETSVIAARGIRKRNARLKGLAIEPNQRSRDQASVAQQVENILIPSMELIDESSVKGNFEIDAVVDVPIDFISGKPDMTKDIEHQAMITGRMFTDKNPVAAGVVRGPDGNPISSARHGGTQRHRVVIQVNEGDRGIFPHWSYDKMKDDGTQGFTLPPGKLRIIEQRPDGTIVAQVVEQKNTQEVLDSLVSNMGKDAGTVSGHNNSTRNEVQSVVDRYLVQRSESGMPMKPPKNRAMDNIEEANIQTTRSVVSSGGSFGEPPGKDYVSEVSKMSSGVSPSRARKKFDGSTPSDVYGPAQTREQRAQVRTGRHNETFDGFKSVLSSGPSDSMPGLTRESMDPRVADLVSTASNEELMKRVEDSAVEMHNGFDKRPRVRMRQSELDDFVKSGTIRNGSGSKLSSGPSAESGRRMERRVAPNAERLLNPQMETIRTSDTGRAAMPTSVGSAKLSSGASMRRHADRPADMERMFPNPEEEAKRLAHEDVAKAWKDSGYGWIEVPRYQADKNLSNDFLRGRELGVNQAEFQWSGDQAIGMKPKDFNPKARGSEKYFQWYDNWLKSMRTYLDAHGKDANGNPRMDDEWRGIEAAIWEKKIGLMPDTTSWQKEQIRTLENSLKDRKFDMAQRPSPIGTKSLKMQRGERTLINSGPAIDRLLSEYHTKIGIDPSIQEHERPVTGYLVHKSHIDEKRNIVKQTGQGNFGTDAVYEVGDRDVVGDGLTALGDIEVVLRKETSGRTAYGMGESISNGHRPVLLNSTDSQDITDALTNVEGLSGKKKNSESVLHLLGAGLDNNFAHVNAGMDENGMMAPVGKHDTGKRSRDIFEAHILGGFNKDDVEGIHYPYSRLKAEAANLDISNVITTEIVNAELKKLGASPIEIQDFNNQLASNPVNTESMQRLREYLYAKKIKQRYQDQGIGYVRFAHPTGINIENPRSYDKSAIGNEDVVRILTRKIVQELDEMIPKTLNSMRKNKTPQLIGGG